MYKISALILIVFNVFLILIMILSRPIGVSQSSMPKEFYQEKIKPITENDWAKLLSNDQKNAHTKQQISHIKQESLPNNQNENQTVDLQAVPTQQKNTVKLSEHVKTIPACYAWGGFNITERDQASQILNYLQINSSMTQREIREITGYWVFIPPVKNEKTLNKLLDHLYQSGVNNFTLIQQGERFKNSVSLGFFKVEELAIQRLNEVRQRGIKQAIMRPRERIATMYYFLVSQMNESQEQQLLQYAKNFEAVSLNKVNCK